MSDTVPITTRGRLADALGDVEALARAKGLECTFADELGSLRRSVEDAVDFDDPSLADRAMREARVLWGLLRGTPASVRGASARA